MTSSVSSLRWRADGWTYIRGGRLVLVLAVLVFLLQGDGSSLPGVLAGFGEVGIIIGTYMVTTSGFLWTIPVGIVTVFCSSVGLNTAADARALALSGQRVTCEVMAVTPHVVSRATEVDAYGRARTRTYTDYRHTMKCPIGTYTAASGVREPVGQKLDMVHTRGDGLEFPTAAEIRYGLGLASVGGLAALFLPLAVRSVERLVGRRRALRPPTEPPAPRTSEPPFQDE